MYLLMILFITVVAPFLVMPRYIIKGGRNPYDVVLISVITICAAAAVIFMGASMVGDGVLSQLHGSVEEISKAAAQDPTVIKALKLESHDMAERVKLLTAVYDEVLKLIPVCIMILSCLTSYIAYLILSKSLSRRGEVNRMPRFREFDMPNTAVFVLVAIYMIVWLATMTGSVENSAFYTNMDLLFDFVMYLQGASVIFMLFYVKHIPKGFALALTIVLWNIYMGRSIIVMLGIFDLIFSFKYRLLYHESKKRR